MAALIAAALFFAGIHIGISGTRLRDALVARIGERAYLAGFSLLSVLGLAALIWAFGEARTLVPLAHAGLRWAVALLMLPAVLLIVLGVLARGPTAVGDVARALAQPQAARGVHRITRHPFLWGAALWAALHALANPQWPALLFFGCFLALTLAGTRSIDAKRARRFGVRWDAYAAATSNLPFAAILQRRNRLVLAELGLAPVLAGLAAYAALLIWHGPLFGLPAL